MPRRCLFLVALLLFAAGLSGCSYLTDFVVVNDSGAPVEVRYQIKNYPGTFSPPVAPASMSASELKSKGNQQWTTITSSRFQLDEANRTVIVQLSPQEALLVTRMHNYAGHDNPADAQEFPIQQISLSGVHGETKFVGEQARRSFTEISSALYTLTYK